MVLYKKLSFITVTTLIWLGTLRKRLSIWFEGAEMASVKLKLVNASSVRKPIDEIFSGVGKSFGVKVIKGTFTENEISMDAEVSDERKVPESLRSYINSPFTAIVSHRSGETEDATIADTSLYDLVKPK